MPTLKIRTQERIQASIRLAREDIARDMEEVLREKEDNPDKANHMKRNIFGKLIKKMLPGQSNSIGAVLQENGTISNEPAAMAKAIKLYWEEVFSKKEIDEGVADQLAEIHQGVQGEAVRGKRTRQ